MYTQQFKTRCQRYAFYITGVGKPIELSDNIRWPKGQRQNGKGLQCACHRVDGQKKGNSVTSCVCSWNPCLIAKNNWFTIYIFISLCVVYLRTWMIWFTVNSPAWNNFFSSLVLLQNNPPHEPTSTSYSWNCSQDVSSPVAQFGEFHGGARQWGSPSTPSPKEIYSPIILQYQHERKRSSILFSDFPWFSMKPTSSWAFLCGPLGKGRQIKIPGDAQGQPAQDRCNNKKAIHYSCGPDKWALNGSFISYDIYI
jgi:hypothetical protein